MNTTSFIRQLARSNYWQTLYSSSKENNGVHLFANTENLSGLQVQFLNWLRIYDMLYTELAHLEDNKLTENVIKEDLRCDAYLYYRRKKIENEWKKHREEERLEKLKQLHPKKRASDANIIDVQLRSK